jgi:hypothetical protein
MVGFLYIYSMAAYLLRLTTQSFWFPKHYARMSNNWAFSHQERSFAKGTI